MESSIFKLKKIRQFILSQICDLTTEQLNKIPNGFNNNIIWNVAHMICAQQSICYLRSDNKVVVEDQYLTPFLTNSKPERWIDHLEIEVIINLFTSTIDQLEMDYVNGLFQSFMPSPNIYRIYNIEIKNIADALEFLLYHDGYHIGTILALKKLISQ